MTFSFKVEQPESGDAKNAIAMWTLGWADRVVLGETDGDGMASIEVVPAEDWQSGPSEMVAWVEAKMRS